MPRRSDIYIGEALSLCMDDLLESDTSTVDRFDEKFKYY